jgi:hypothetical protein
VPPALMTDIRAHRIDDAVSAAGELIAALLDKGPVGPGQARTIVEATVRAAVPNFEHWEIRDAALRIAGELEGLGKHENQSSDVR